MKFRKTLIGACALAVVAAFSSSAAVAADKVVFVAADVHPADYPTTAAIINMGKKLEAATNGRLSVKMYPSGQMGDETATIEKARAGAIDILRVSMAPMGSLLPETNVFAMPFVFHSVDHQHKVLDGPIGQNLGEKITASSLRLVFLGWMDAGSRSLITKKPITSLADLKGVKIRVQNNPVAIDTFKALGANAIALGTSEVFPSLQTGVIDAAENNEPTFDSENYAVAGTKYYTRTNHFMIPEVFAFSKVKWEKLSAADQALIKKLSKEVEQDERKLWAEYTTKSIKNLENHGVKFSDIDTKPFFEATAPVRAKYGAAFPELLKSIEAVK